jgi:hypothetical protein
MDHVATVSELELQHPRPCRILPHVIPRMERLARTRVQVGTLARRCQDNLTQAAHAGTGTGHLRAPECIQLRLELSLRR